MTYREDSDSLGTVRVPRNELYSANTIRGAENFHLIGDPVSNYPSFIKTMARVKKAAARANLDCGALAPEIGRAIITACDEIAEGRHHDNFIVALAEGSGGTSINMNFNEVIANRAGQMLGDQLGSFRVVHPNDHVNLSQSTNDVLPTAIQLTCIADAGPLLEAGRALARAFRDKAEAYRDTLRVGRTCMQAAQPMTYGQLFDAYATIIEQALHRVEEARLGLFEVPMGATAIGTGLAAVRGYRERIVLMLRDEFGVEVHAPADYFAALQSTGGFARLSGELKILAQTLGKIAADLVILGSGGNSGLGEILLPPVQAGSSIMAGKVNPVICMMVQQIAFMVQGYDTMVSIAALNGQMEINHFEPLIAQALFASIALITRGCEIFRARAIDGLGVDAARSYANLANSAAMSSVFLPHLGYARLAGMVKRAADAGTPLADVAVAEGLMTREDIRRLLEAAARGRA